MTFENSMRHHNFRSEMMSYANLVQNKQLIDAQYQTNAILAENERIRQQEKQIDLWAEEFKFQGMSPIEANQQALAEWEINEIKLLGEQFTFEFQSLYENSIDIVKNQIAQKPLRKAILGSLSNKFISINEDSDEVFMFECMAEKQWKENISQLQEKLNGLPPSKLFDDSNLRNAFLEVSTKPIRLDVFDKISELLDGFVNQFDSLLMAWNQVFSTSAKFKSGLEKMPQEVQDSYSALSLSFWELQNALNNFSGNLKSLIKSDSTEQVFHSEIIVPFGKLSSDFQTFQKLLKNY